MDRTDGRSQARRAGVTMPEVLVSLGILALVALVMLAVFGGGLQRLFGARGRTVALNLAQEKLEGCLTCPQAELASASGAFTGRFSRFGWTVKVQDVAPGLKRVVVAVSASAAESATLTAYRRAGEGRIVYSQVGPDGNEDVWSCLPDGSGVERLTTDPARDTQPALSPDGRRVAFASNRSGLMQVYLLDLAQRVVTPLTRHPVGAQSPAWSPDGAMLAYVATAESGYSQIYVAAASGGGSSNVSQTSSHETAPCWSPDGVHLCWCTDRFGGLQLVVATADGGAQRRITSASGWNASPAWSPDGRWIAFLSTRDGTPQIYLTDPDGQAVQKLTQTKAGMNGEPSWSPDGRQLAFFSERDGAPTLYVMNRDGTGQRRLFAAASAMARAPSWVR